MPHTTDSPSPAAAAGTAAPTIAFTFDGAVPPGQVDWAREAFTRVLDHAHEPVLYVHATLAQEPVPTVSVRVDLNGRPVHAHATAASLHEAISLTADRITSRLQRNARDWESRRGRHPRGARRAG
ncbi:HPF/RaiA family ribosome-associated protein [Actinomadura oligospora]|uniref:HPF/RaiA family ribosome-associated protein n=1 Tax=Actinomadura oligospora TaxID=111804 RepID=UPI00047BEEC2|nr:HPF/RaiA family ribosome-associated protein [Actinomadura oligospora]